jgi:hypothetical protein
VGKGVTSLSSETKSDIDINDASGHFLNSFSEIFDCELRLLQDQQENQRVFK